MGPTAVVVLGNGGVDGDCTSCDWHVGGCLHGGHGDFRGLSFLVCRSDVSSQRKLHGFGTCTFHCVSKWVE